MKVSKKRYQSVFECYTCDKCGTMDKTVECLCFPEIKAVE